MERLYKSAAIVFFISLAAAVMPFMQKAANGSFFIGFPFAFLTVRHGLNFSTHLNLLSLIADIFCIDWLFGVIGRFAKKEGKSGLF